MSTPLSPPPWQKIYDELGVSAPPFDDRPLGTHLEQHAVERPDSVALQFFDREISYGELNSEANRLATALQALGVDRNSVIGLHMPNLPQYCVALAAISKLGCAGSGVSPLLAPVELAYQVEDAGISVLVSFDGLADAVRGAAEHLPDCLQHIVLAGAADYIGGTAVERDNIAGRDTHDYLALMATGDDEFRQREVSSDDRFMIQYTGGTTGKPKGAVLSVRNLMYNMCQFNAFKPWQLGNEVCATAFPLFHAAGLAVILAGMRFGARSLLIPDARDIEFFCRQMQRFPPTRMAGVPTLYMMLVNCPLSEDIDFSGLQTAVSGAAPLPMDDRMKIEALLGPGMPSDVFGMTETGPVHVANPPQRLKPTSLGIPVPGADTRIVDLETGSREMPFGEAGEIITAGPHVMKGYLNLPEESAKAMREWQGRTWMYTGDVGFMDEEGYITICDRAKDMLIVGGFKVFSVEVEDKLKALDFIAESAVIGTEDEQRPGNDIVNLYVQLAPAASQGDEDELRSAITEFCRTNMSPYKVPRNILFIDEIPLTPVGKLDKKVLRKRLPA